MLCETAGRRWLTHGNRLKCMHCGPHNSCGAFSCVGALCGSRAAARGGPCPAQVPERCRRRRFAQTHGESWSRAPAALIRPRIASGDVV
jgi:hypothetical protein